MGCVKNVFCGVLVLMAGWSVSAMAADPASKPTEDEQRAARLKLLRQLGETVQIVVMADGKATPVKMLPEPLHRYKRESQQYADAVVWAWGDGGRPTALLTLCCHVTPSYSHLMCEFDSLSPRPLEGRMGDEVRWSPQGAGLDMKRLPNAPAPAEDQPGRLQQIGELTARMKADEAPYIFAATDPYGAAGAEKPKNSDLPWLPKPVYRYSDPAHGIIDGALCFACLESDPEVILVLEAQRHGDAPPAWYYGFNRSAFAELHVRFDGKPLWTAPRLSGTAPANPYHMMSMPLQ